MKSWMMLLGVGWNCNIDASLISPTPQLTSTFLHHSLVTPFDTERKTFSEYIKNFLGHIF